jgi:hypothetical protein
MRRMTFWSLALSAFFVVGLARGDDSKKKDDVDRHHGKATITKVDAKKSTVTVTMKDPHGKDAVKTIPLTLGAAYLDSDGKSAKLDAFQPGDHIRFIEEDGKILEMKKCAERTHATITKVDAKKGTITVTMQDRDGKEVDKTFEVAKEAEYFDSHGKAAKLDTFKAEDHVRITEKDGKIAELKECTKQTQATITKVDTEKGEITVTMKDSDGKKTEKVFSLIEEAEYVDSTGEVDTVDIFRSGDEVLIIESDGQLSELKQDPKQKKSGEKTQTPVGKKTSSK